MDSFEKLEVWQRSQALSIEIYRVLNGCRDFGFKDQITRAGNSVPDNIAEGAERLSKREFVQFLSFAKGSAGEVRSQVHRAGALGYISAADVMRLRQELVEISRMIKGLIRSMQADQKE